MILSVDLQSAHPIYEQLRDQIVLGIASGALRDGEALPSVRRLGADLGINLHTVSKAYSVLCDEGYAVMDRRRGATVQSRIPDSGEFQAGLMERLTLAAAEAQCRGMTPGRFMELCAAGYEAAAGGRKGDENE